MSEELYTVEYSHVEERDGRFPYHYQPLSDTLKCNMQFWQIPSIRAWTLLYIGTFDECYRLVGELLEKRPMEKQET